MGQAAAHYARALDLDPSSPALRAEAQAVETVRTHIEQGIPTLTSLVIECVIEYAQSHQAGSARRKTSQQVLADGMPVDAAQARRCQDLLQHARRVG